MYLSRLRFVSTLVFSRFVWHTNYGLVQRCSREAGMNDGVRRVATLGSILVAWLTACTSIDCPSATVLKDGRCVDEKSLGARSKDPESDRKADEESSNTQSTRPADAASPTGNGGSGTRASGAGMSASGSGARDTGTNHGRAGAMSSAGASATMAAGGGAGKSAGASGASGAPAGKAGAGASAAPSGAGGAAGMQPSGSPPAKLPRVTSTEGMGPFADIVKVKNAGPGPGGWLIYPRDIGRDGIKHPSFVFVPGGGTTPDFYDKMGMVWDRLVSYGFVVFGVGQTGGAAALKAVVDWLIAQDSVADSPLYQKLDRTKIGVGGHSQGSVVTFEFMPDARISTTVHVSGGSLDGMGPAKLTKDALFLCGLSMEMALPQCDVDYENSKVPTFYARLQGATHIAAVQVGLPAIIAWLLWHLADQEDPWKREFLEPTGRFQKGIYQSQAKNW